MWQKLGRELPTDAARELPSWDAANLLRESAKTFDNYARQLLEGTHADSDAALQPFRDPLGLNLGKHRWLSADREESYSDWLAWILQGMSGADEILPLFALDDDFARHMRGEGSVRRELPSEWGRTDVVVRFGDRGLFLIEVKVAPTQKEELLDQLRRYEEWAGQQAVGQTFFALLGTVKPAHGIRSFAFMDWRTLCQRLRRYANRVKGSDLLRAAGILIFCGAVEQNLLGFSIPPGYLRAMATIDYLCEWRREA